MGQTTVSEEFEDILEEGRRELAATRETYGALEGSRDIPEGVLELIGQLEQDLEQLEQSLEVTEDDVQLAEQAVRRVSILSGLFDALYEGERAELERRIAVLEAFVGALETLIEEEQVADSTSEEFGTIERKLSMVKKLAANERYAQIANSDRVSIESLLEQAKDVEAQVDEAADARALAERYLTVLDTLLDDIHEWLSGLGGANEHRTAFSSDLSSIKGDIETAESALEDDDDETAAERARDTLLAAVAVADEVARVSGEQQASIALADVVDTYALEVECEVAECRAQGTPTPLVTAISDSLSGQLEVSTSEQIQQLLLEHDGDVVRTAQATDFEVEEIIEALQQLYQEGAVDSIEVELNE